MVKYETLIHRTSMPKTFTTKRQKIGKLGEQVATRFLMKHNHKILDQNYTRPWGEIDIVSCEKSATGNILHFIEVKSLKVTDLNLMDTSYNPAENLHYRKRLRMAKTIKTYLWASKIPENQPYQVDLIIVYLDLKRLKSRLKVVNQIIL
ncbi:MAG TPA: YraN family protein [Candidatus Paceibacterota bacterium]|nr:YraN family protein [Candidatus Paceibacterota bacterium]